MRACCVKIQFLTKEKGDVPVQTYIAHYSSPAASDSRGQGVFEFESDARIGTKANTHDARMRMLEVYGKDAISWNIVKVERKKAKPKADQAQDGQLQLDFRPPKVERKRAKRKEWW